MTLFRHSSGIPQYGTDISFIFALYQVSAALSSYYDLMTVKTIVSMDSYSPV